MSCRRGEGEVDPLILASIGITTAIIQFGCLITVIYFMIKKSGLWLALFGFCCCQIYAFYWGWAEWEHEGKKPVMIVWTICLIYGVILRFTGNMEELSSLILK